jgi:hypothetical protein
MSMLSGLVDAVEALDLPLHGEAIAEAMRLRDRLDAKIAVAVGGYDAQGLFAVDGAVSMTGWLKQHAGMTPGAAASLAKIAKRLQQLPAVRDAWLGADLTGGQVQAIVANVTDATIDQLQDQEAELIPLLRPLSVTDTADVMKLWRAHAEALIQDEPTRDQQRSAHLSELLDGRGRLDADLDPEGLALAKRALRLAESPDCDGEPSRTPAERRGDALVDILRYFLDHQDHLPTGRNRPHVNVVIDWDRYQHGHGGEYVDGGNVSPATIRRILCDANVNRVVTQGRSVILDYGTTTRLFSDVQFAAIALRDRHCRHAGCDRPPEWCEVHHVIPAEDNGPTALWNGLLKCTRHHHIGHLPGWTEKLEPDGTYHLTAPDGRTWTTHPPGVTRPMI